MANNTGAYVGNCPSCGSIHTKVIWTDLPRRRRECKVCSARFTSIEILETELGPEDFSQIRYVVSLLAHVLKST